MKDDFLLGTKSAEKLYVECARDLPIIDYHNHVSVGDVIENRKFDNIHELWLASDPYKHRLMRISGIDEHFITGDAEPREKFEKFCEIFPCLAGNPVFDWAKMELDHVFGIDVIPSKENAGYIYDKCGEMLRGEDFRNNEILKKFNVEYSAPVVSLLDDISGFKRKDFAPSLRGDNLLAPTAETYRTLEALTGKKVSDTASYIAAVAVMLDRLTAVGCSVADHALDTGFLESTENEVEKEILTLLAGEYAKRGWTMLLHLNASRKTSSRLRNLAGPFGGFAAAGQCVSITALTSLLDRMESTGGLPSTVLFSLNMSDFAPLAILQGSFSECGIPSKVQLGPAWWWCDHALGIESALGAVSSFGVLSEFIGMTTDSRSILSFVRHDYFRRILCTWIDRQNREMCWGLGECDLGRIIKKICYENAREKIITKEKRK